MFLIKKSGLVLVSRNSAAITLTSLPLKNLVKGLFKIFSMLIRELAWILKNCMPPTISNILCNIDKYFNEASLSIRRYFYMANLSTLISTYAHYFRGSKLSLF